jgi:hypothetical protein
VVSTLDDISTKITPHITSHSPFHQPVTRTKPIKNSQPQEKDMPRNNQGKPNQLIPFHLGFFFNLKAS